MYYKKNQGRNKNKEHNLIKLELYPDHNIQSYRENNRKIKKHHHLPYKHGSIMQTYLLIHVDQ